MLKAADVSAVGSFRQGVGALGKGWAAPSDAVHVLLM